MRGSSVLVVSGLVLAGIGYWLTTLGTQAYRWAPDWIWHTVQQRPTIVVVGLIIALWGAVLRFRKS